jgi:nucleotide-binding universal stress UspA family protein
VSTFTERILVAVDTPEGSRHVVRAAAELAAALGADLHLVHVRLTRSTVQGRPVTPAQKDAMHGASEDLLDALAGEATRAGRAPVELHVRLGERVETELVRAQAELEAGLLVVGGGRGGGVVRRLFGDPGPTASTVRRSPGSVLVVRPPAADA